MSKVNEDSICIHMLTCVTIWFLCLLIPTAVAYIAVCFIGGEWYPLNVFEWHIFARIVLTLWFVVISMACIGAALDSHSR